MRTPRSTLSTRVWSSSTEIGYLWKLVWSLWTHCLSATLEATWSQVRRRLFAKYELWYDAGVLALHYCDAGKTYILGLEHKLRKVGSENPGLIARR